jgi:hypothetical protein
MHRNSEQEQARSGRLPPRRTHVRRLAIAVLTLALGAFLDYARAFTSTPNIKDALALGATLLVFIGAGLSVRALVLAFRWRRRSGRDDLT